MSHFYVNPSKTNNLQIKEELKNDLELIILKKVCVSHEYIPHQQYLDSILKDIS